MTIKAKLSIGLGLLFAIIFALSMYATARIDRLAGEAGAILKDNYDSIRYARSMDLALGDMNEAITAIVLDKADDSGTRAFHVQQFEAARKVFETNLAAENSNITEIGEGKCVERLNGDYRMFLKISVSLIDGSAGSALFFNEFLPVSNRVEDAVMDVNDINMQAVVRKSDETKENAAGFRTSMTIFAAFAILLAFAYFWYFPFYIAFTLRYLADRMKGLLDKAGLRYEGPMKDETVFILNGINLLENSIGVEDTANGAGEGGSKA